MIGVWGYTQPRAPRVQVSHRTNDTHMYSDNYYWTNCHFHTMPTTSCTAAPAEYVPPVMKTPAQSSQYAHQAFLFSGILYLFKRKWSFLKDCSVCVCLTTLFLVDETPRYQTCYYKAAYTLLIKTCLPFLRRKRRRLHVLHSGSSTKGCASSWLSISVRVLEKVMFEINIHALVIYL